MPLDKVKVITYITQFWNRKSQTEIEILNTVWFFFLFHLKNKQYYQQYYQLQSIVAAEFTDCISIER